MTKICLELRQLAPPVEEIQQDSRLRIGRNSVPGEVVLENDPIILPVDNDRSSAAKSIYSGGHDLGKLLLYRIRQTGSNGAKRSFKRNFF
jgi:hypothetical protein